jgi:hypothetical protein
MRSKEESKRLRWQQIKTITLTLAAMLACTLHGQQTKSLSELPPT